jgi:hypothetical protein
MKTFAIAVGGFLVLIAICAALGLRSKTEMPSALKVRNDATKYELRQKGLEPTRDNR